MAAVYQIHIGNALAVGMHHWGPRQLQVGSVYKLLQENVNTEDHNAVAIHELSAESAKRAYLTREWACKIHEALSYAKYAVLRVDEPAVVVNYEKGPQHKCLIVMWCTESTKMMMSHHLNLNNISYTIKL